MTDNTANLHPTTTSQQLTDLDEGVEYKVWVRARYHDGADGPWSGSWAETTRQVAARPSSGVRSDDEPPVTLEPPQLTVIEPDDPDDPPVALQQSADGSVSEPADGYDPPVTLAPLQLTVIEPDTDDPDDPDVPLVALPTPGQLIPALWAGSVSGRRSGSALWERPCVDAHPPSQRTHRGAQPPSLDCCLSWQT